MDIKTLIADYRADYDAQAPTFDSLANIDAELAKGLPLEKKTVLRSIRAEVLGVLYNEVLTQWLIANAIPESIWHQYYFDGTEVIHRGE